MTSSWALRIGITLMTFGVASPTVTADESAATQRARIATEKQAIQQRYEAKERDCAQRFVVTSCTNAARKERRDSLVPLRQEELRIDRIERKLRGAARLEEIEAKQRADAARSAASVPQAPPASPAPPGVAAADRPAGALSKPLPRPGVDAAERQHREAANQARFDASQRDAQRRRQAAELRNEKRAAAGKVVRPLPMPPAASAP